jgi:LmbE family N-acetylglucosaminyl deacetylase
VKLIVDERHVGPSAEAWDDRMSRESIDRLSLEHVRRLVVVAPHPDDEVLGAGRLIQEALREGVLVEVISVTNGEASHPRSQAAQEMDLANVRRRESQLALERLGWDQPLVTFLELPDGDVLGHRQELDDTLESMLLPDDLCVAPWRNDGHPDHDVCGESAQRASLRVGAKSLGYLVWAWHWAHPDGYEIPFDRCLRLDFGRRAQARKRWSTEAFRSQVLPLGPSKADQAILPPPLLRRFWRPYEIFVSEAAKS